MSSFTDERDEAFYRAYRRAWNEGAVSHSEAVERALGSATERLWVSERYVRKLFDRRMRGRFSVGGPRDGLYEEMWQSFCRIRRDNPSRTVASVIRMLVFRPARGFPFGRRTAERVIKRARRRFRTKV